MNACICLSSGCGLRIPQATVEWAGGVKQRTFTFHLSGGCKSKMKVLAGDSPGENLVPGLASSHGGESERSGLFFF